MTLSAFVVGSPKGDLGHLGDLLPKRGLLKVTFLFKSLLSKRKEDGDVLTHHMLRTKLGYLYGMIPVIFNKQ